MSAEKEIHPKCIKCGKIILNSTHIGRKYCFECRQIMLGIWGKKSAKSNKVKTG